MNTSEHTRRTQDWEKDYKVRRTAAKEWDALRDIFIRLYITEDRILTDVRRIMAEQHGFYVNPKQCKSAIKRWKLEKNLNKTKAAAMIRIKDKRAIEGKDTSFKLHGQPVDARLLERSRKRYKEAGWDELGSLVATTPPGVEYSTPKPSSTPDSCKREDLPNTCDLLWLGSTGSHKNDTARTDTGTTKGPGQQIHQAGYTPTAEASDVSHLRFKDDEMSILTVEGLDNFLADPFGGPGLTPMWLYEESPTMPSLYFD